VPVHATSFGTWWMEKPARMVTAERVAMALKKR
jgi:hypothetical protein